MFDEKPDLSSASIDLNLTTIPLKKGSPARIVEPSHLYTEN
jgi:hypothetical protein